MSDSKYRLLLVGTHPVQYVAPQLRRLAQHPKLEILVAYLSLHGAKPFVDPGFGVEITWDIPLLDGYPWVELGKTDRNGNSKWRSIQLKRQVWDLVEKGRFDALYVSGYNFPEAWIALLAAKRSRVAIVLATDAHRLQSSSVQSRFATKIKRLVLRQIYSLADVVMVSSTGGVDYVNSLGVGQDRIFLAGSVVDNGWWTERAAQVDRAAVRHDWNIPVDAAVVLCCARLQALKRPGDVLEAFARAHIPGSYLVFAGEGPLRAALEQQARGLAIDERVRFLGFVNQSGLPGVYAASDLMVLASEHEPFGVVVNEAMLCGCPVIVSDRVGAKYDLIRASETGDVFLCGNVDALADILRRLLSDKVHLKQMGAAAKERMKTWTPEMNVEVFARAVELAVKSRAKVSTADGGS